MMDSAAEVTVKDALKTPKIVFTPKQKMREHRPQRREGFHGRRHCHRAGRGRDGKSAGLRRELGAAGPRVRRAAASRSFNGVMHKNCARLASSLTDWKTGNLSKENPHILWTFRDFALSLPQRSKRRNGNHLQREILARNVSHRTDGQETPLSASANISA